MQTARIAALIVVASLAAVRPASAQEARQRQAAAEAYDQGTAAYLAGEYEKAAEWFETANRLAPAAPALIQAARALQEAGLHARAATLALRLTVEYEGDPASTKFAQDLLDRLRGQLFRVDVTCDGCTLDVDGSLQEWPSFFVSPDETHVVTAGFETGERKAEVNGTAGESTTLQFDAPPPPVGETPENPTRRFGASSSDLQPSDRDAKPLPPLVTFVGAGLTAALAAGAVISTIDMNSGVDEYEDAVDEYNACTPPESPACTELYEAAEKRLEDGQATETRSTVLWVATGVVGAATLAVALLLTDWDEGEGEDTSRAKRPGLAFGLSPGTREASLVVKGTF